MLRLLSLGSPLLLAGILASCGVSVPVPPTSQAPPSSVSTQPLEAPGAPVVSATPTEPGGGEMVTGSQDPLADSAATSPAPASSAAGEPAPGFLFVERREVPAAPPTAWTNEDYLSAGHVVASGMTPDQVVAACQAYQVQSQVGLYDHVRTIAEAHELAQTVSPVSLQAAMATVLLDECEARQASMTP